MSELAAKRLSYGNWVSAKWLYIPAAISLVSGGLSFAFPMLVVVAILFFLCFIYFAYARYRLSPRGGDIQAGVQNLSEFISPVLKLPFMVGTIGILHGRK